MGLTDCFHKRIKLFIAANGSTSTFSVSTSGFGTTGATGVSAGECQMAPKFSAQVLQEAGLVANPELQDLRRQALPATSSNHCRGCSRMDDGIGRRLL